MLRNLLGYVGIFTAAALDMFAAYSLYGDSPRSKLQRAKLFFLMGVMILFTVIIVFLIQQNDAFHKALMDALVLFYKCMNLHH